MCAYGQSYNTKALPDDYEFVGLTEISGYLQANVCYVCVKRERECGCEIWGKRGGWVLGNI